jgi:hypothetical protein
MKHFIHFMFSPGNGFLLFLISIIAISGLTICAWFNSPYSFNAVIGMYFTLVLALFMGSYIRFINYRNNAPRIQRWNDSKRKFEDQIIL